ncbi:MAG: hypothetical protein Q9224_007613, partial [Gallowayella concinna]
MACPGGCTNGGGQIKVDDIGIGQRQVREGMMSQKEWLGVVDEAYYSMVDDDGSSPYSSSSSSSSFVGSPLRQQRQQQLDGDEDVVMMADEGVEMDGGMVNGIDVVRVRAMLRHWSQ